MRNVHWVDTFTMTSPRFSFGSGAWSSRTRVSEGELVNFSLRTPGHVVWGVNRLSMCELESKEDLRRARGMCIRPVVVISGKICYVNCRRGGDLSSSRFRVDINPAGPSMLCALPRPMTQTGLFPSTRRCVCWVHASHGRTGSIHFHTPPPKSSAG